MWMRVTNDYDASLDVIVEPWGDCVRLQPKQSIGVFWHGPEEAFINIHASPGRIELWANGSENVLLQLDRNGEMDREIGMSEGVAPPPRFHRRSDLP